MFDDVLVDRRAGRRGFAQPVLAELPSGAEDVEVQPVRSQVELPHELVLIDPARPHRAPGELENVIPSKTICTPQTAVHAADALMSC